ncbi:NDP-hexose 2,3-dehydratase family protein [Saccharomonospora iraqiensis]|uniref:NDP-hexose 2,3-dehydratase family protein n=1 Tax=Saccharomonospora iraqiensis TaxID=52698 RepID=UPI00022E4CBF|nr:NDP-hexose 2,3-dehydratase family protein [Saccharomonospora iraqiensis]
MTVDLHSRTPHRPGLAARLAASAAAPTDGGRSTLRWLRERRDSGHFRVTPVPFARLDGWSFRSVEGDLVHRSGRFFRVEGMDVTARDGTRHWRQPILRQDDIAVLGILAREFNGVLHFLLQAKMEPGNIGMVQLSPTVQSTPSNYSRAHRGRTSRYIEGFLGDHPGRTLVDILQSEQGSWFIGKRNRNVVVEVDEPVDVHDDFRWLTLAEIFALLRHPDIVNMDTRTVLSCLPLALDEATPARNPELARAVGGPRNEPRHGATEIDDWLHGWRKRAPLSVERIPLAATAADGWVRDDSRIAHHTGRWFRIIGVTAAADNREVGAWSQPLLQPCGVGLTALVTRRIRGTLHLLVRADARPGYRSGVEIGPTLQCTPSNCPPGTPGRPDLLDTVLATPPERVLHDSRQSEEGGRFHHATTRHLIVEQDPREPLDPPPGYLWISAAQLADLVSTSCQVNIEARSLLLSLLATIHSTPTRPSGGAE